MRFRAAIILLAVLSLAAKSRYTVREKTDEFTGHTYHIMDGNLLGCAKSTYEPKIEMDFQHFVPKDGEASFQIFVRYTWSTWMFMDEHQPLIFLIDGARQDLEMSGTPKHDNYSGSVFERGMYEIDEEMLRSLAAASEVKVRIPGTKMHVDRCFDADNTARLRAFLAKYLPEEGKPPAESAIPPEDESKKRKHSDSGSTDG